ncbi:MAG: hypothetical protein ACREB9_05440 [Thermoplasmata archaeon]
MSNRSKGRSKEKQVEAILQADGWLTHRALPAARAIGPGRFVTHSNDFFGVGDIIAVRQGEFRLVQVTSLGQSSIRRAKVQGVMGPHVRFGTVSAEVWAWGKTQKLGYHYSRWTLALFAHDATQGMEPRWIEMEPVDSKGGSIVEKGGEKGLSAPKPKTTPRRHAAAPSTLDSWNPSR